MRRCAAIFLIGCLAGCGGGPRDDAPDTTTGSETVEGRPVVSGPDGVPVDCPYRVADLCYDSSEAACAAAGCAPDACQILESYPAQITCR